MAATGMRRGNMPGRTAGRGGGVKLYGGGAEWLGGYSTKNSEAAECDNQARERIIIIIFPPSPQAKSFACT